MADSLSSTPFMAGAAERDITPAQSVFLFGYPNVPRMSTGVHDPLLASALFVGRGEGKALFIATDLIFVARAFVAPARQRIAEATGLTVEQIMITATHTHSGPLTAPMLSNASDPIVPPVDAAYLAEVEQTLVTVGIEAVRSAQPATLRWAVTDGSALGTNRRDPQGPAIARQPVLIAEPAAGGQPIAVMVITSMHPTVLHEDWTQISGDFPGLARTWLREQGILSAPLVYHMGASGNQSPRHVVQGNTIEEARRLGQLLGEQIQQALQKASRIEPGPVQAISRGLDLPLREFPEPAAAEVKLRAAESHFASLKAQGAPATSVRTAECDLFGAQETLTLSRAAQKGQVAAAAAHCLPAEVQVIRIADQAFIGWPGEVFVEFAQQVMADHLQATLITLANDVLEGYLVTEEAVQEGGYEASNALFASPAGGEALVQATGELLRVLQKA